jgi:Mrp family chromosome partitioning ATPase
MTQSPPKASTSSRPPGGASGSTPPRTAPSVVDAGRLMTSLAAGGSVLLLGVTAVVLWPRTYGTEATLVLDGGARVDNPQALASRIEAALLERDQLASAAMELPPELRSPDPIGRLRAGIRVQARGALGYAIEFRGSDPQSVQRIANRLADRAVAVIPKLTASPEDAAPLKEVAARSRAVSEFLSAHPEVAVEQPGDKAATPNPNNDSALDLLRTEKRQIEQKLAAAAVAAVDNPYADPPDDAAQLNRRLAELNNTIAKREAALKQPRAAAPAASQDLTNQWRKLLADLAAAQAKAAAPAAHPSISAHVSARAPLPTSPLTPNRLVLSLVALLLSLAAAMVAYVLPRKATLPRSPQPRPRSDPPPPGAQPRPRSDPPPARPRSDPPQAAAPRPRSDPPPPAVAERPRSDPPPGRGSGSEPPGPMAPQRTVVLTSATATSEQLAERRTHTAPGGLEAPSAAAVEAMAATVLQPPPKARSSPPPAAPLFGSRPPPGAGSYSVSSSHPPPAEGAGNNRTSVERLSPLQSAHPPPAANVPPGVFDSDLSHPSPPPDMPQIMSKPPALDPEAERWAARFENPPPPEAEVQPEAAPKKKGRWKTQAMGSMVPLEVSSMREERPPPSEAPVSVEDRRIVPAYAMNQPEPLPAGPEMLFHDVPSGWRPQIDLADPQLLALRDAVMAQGLSRRLRIAITGSAGNGKVQLACGLSLSLAEVGARVLLLEADFDHPQVHQTLGFETPSGAGFSQQIMARLHSRQAKPWILVRCSPNLQVLAEGRLRSPGLVASSGFERAVHELAQAHHVVVIHAPALDRAVELRALDTMTQAVVIAHSKEPATIRFGDNPLRGFV